MFAGLREQVPAEQSVGIIFEMYMTKTNVGHACMKRHLPFVPAKHEDEAICKANRGNPNVCRIAGAGACEAIRWYYIRNVYDEGKCRSCLYESWYYIDSCYI